MFVALLASTLEEHVSRAFVFVAPKAATVSVAGEFNGWNKDASPMAKETDGQTWKATLKLKPGRYQYKFVVDGKNWIPDPVAKTVLDGSGNPNSYLLVEPADYSLFPAKEGDGIITTSAFFHLDSKPFLVKVPSGHRVLFKTRRGDVAKAEVVVKGKATPADKVASDDLTDTYVATVSGADHGYSIVLDDTLRQAEFGPFLPSSGANPVQVPQWVGRSVVYHIFPDRFANGSSSNDHPGSASWDSKPKFGTYMGGDIPGVHQRLGYLKSLGVETVYFNPIFTTSSYHGYETSDYGEVDPHFGGTDAFLSLVGDLHKNGMKVVLDGVFNHSGTQFFAFQDLVAKQQASAYKDWYFVNKWPVSLEGKPTYEAWFGFGKLPKLNVNNPELRAYLLNQVSKWNKRGVDGWRLDAANEVDPEFWKVFRQRVRKDNPNTWICGEVWTDANAWLKGDQFDSTMNYPFREALVEFLARGSNSASECMDKLMANYYLYSPEVSSNLFNLIGSHDTPRFKTLAKGNEDLCALAAVMQFTWPGVPSIYYGDEIGMEGGADPDNRRGMDWKLANSKNRLLNLYTKLAHLRRSHPALSGTAPTKLFADDSTQTLGYARISDKAGLMVVVNRSTSSQKIDFTPPDALRPAPARRYTDTLSGQPVKCLADGRLSLTLPPLKAAIVLVEGGFSSIHTPNHPRG